ncbi:Carboxylic ester hydrolase [Mycena indigotica]|uniref:Carboxylic ester hydrolase n=1 Tax=Mycena indigotica TaxID=2126181 RepID=A0A8H6W2H1_9AGAR|nr:Carboxylic ester hydrolase [Mycena indigotica]KAF7296949.1 Carboxylic ester hydrolase [Mycena indigotica]
MVIRHMERVGKSTAGASSERHWAMSLCPIGQETTNSIRERPLSQRVPRSSSHILANMLSLPAAHLLAVYIATFMYGIYVVTLGMAGRALLTLPSGEWRTRRDINWIILAVFCALFINDTLDTVLALLEAMDAFAIYSGPGGPTHVFSHGSGFMTLTKTVCVGIQTLIGDAILIWRCWFIWKSKTQLVIVLPVMGWIANCVLNAWVDQLLSKVTEGLVTGSKIQPFGRAFWILSICINIYATGLIVLRLWMVERNNSQFRLGTGSATTATTKRKTPLARAMRNIVESGLLITVSSILMCIAFTKQSTLNFPASAFAFQSVGIAFNLIIIRSSNYANQETIAPSSIQFHSSPPAALGRGIHTTTTVITDAKQDTLSYPLVHIHKGTESGDYAV